MTPRAKIRLQDVADLAEVSLFSASKVVNGSWRAARISEPCAARVLAAARQLGYSPNYHAQSLMRGRAGAVGLVLRAPQHNDLAYAAELMGGLEAALTERQFDLLIIGRRGPRSEIQHALDGLRQHRVDALVVPGGLGDEVWDEDIEAADGPVVLATAHRGSRLPTVDVDPEPGIAAAIAHLRGLGHASLLWVVPASDDQGGHVAARTALVRGCALGAGMRVQELRFSPRASLIDPASWSAAARAALAELARRQIAPTAAICFNDLAAIGVMQAAHAAGIRVPEALSVIGFDDFRSGLAVPPLTTISHELSAIAARAATIAIGMVEEPARRPALSGSLERIPARLVVRESTAPPRADGARRGGGLAVLVALLGLLAGRACALEDLPSALALAQDWTRRIHPLLERYCLDCHDKDTKSDVRLDALAPAIAPDNVATWTRVKNMLDVGSMPPAGKDRPDAHELDALLGWLDASLARYESDRRDQGGNTLLRRINNRAYANMLKTLLGIPAMGVADFPADGTVQGYDTVGAALYANAGLYDRYFDCALATIDLAMPDQAPPAKPPVNSRSFASATHNFDWERANLDRLIAALKSHPKDLEPLRFALDWLDRICVPPSLKHVYQPHMLRDAICKHYDCTTWDEVGRKWQGRKTTWTSDTTLAEPLIPVLESLRGQLTALEKYVSAFQPAVSQWPGYVQAITVSTPTAGCYEFTTRACLLNPACPMPVGVYVNGALVKHLTLYNDLAHPQTIAYRAWIPAGTTVFAFQSALPNAIYTAPGAWFHFFIDYATAHGWLTPAQAIRETKLLASYHYLVGPEAEREKDAADPLYNLPAVLCDHVAVTGPLVDSWPTPAAAAVFTRGANAEPTRAYAEEIVTTFMRRAYACTEPDPVTAQPYVDLIMAQHAAGKAFPAAVKFGLAAILCSPRFLYLEEHARSSATAREPLSPRELARRLAYFLWSDLPDEALLSAAASGALASDAGLAQELARMLKDPRSQSFRAGFTTQWLKIDHLEDIPFSYELLPSFSVVLLKDAKQESVAFFSEILDHDLSLANFIDSDFAMLNGTMAAHYGIPGVAGDDFRRVPLPKDAHRGGVLGQASVLMATSNGMVESLVKRGAFIMDRLLGLPPGHPPPNVPALDKVKMANDDGSPITPRERMALHRHTISCARCHDKIDPLGVGLEQYDAVGTWRHELRLFLPVPDKETRSQWASLPADVRGALPGGEAFDGPEGLKRQMLGHLDQFTRCLAENLAVYALGRELDASDRPALERILVAVAKDHGGLGTLVQALVQSDLFRDK